MSCDHSENPVHPFADDPTVGERYEWWSIENDVVIPPARLMAVVLLPSATPGLETAMTESLADLWSCSIRWRSARYSSTANEVGATRLTSCSSSPFVASLGSSSDPCGFRYGTTAAMAGASALAGTDGGAWRRRAWSSAARSSAWKNLLMEPEGSAPTARRSARPCRIPARDSQ